MIKTVFTWRDNPNRTAQECEEHYRAVHMNLARSCFDGIDGFVALVYNRVLEHSVNDDNQPTPRSAPSDIDAYCELWFQDRESMQQAFAQPQMKRMFDDHANFMNTEGPANIHVYDVEETVVLRRPDPAG